MAFLHQVRNNKKTAILALMDETSKKGKVNKKPDSKLFYVYRSVLHLHISVCICHIIISTMPICRPNTGQQVKQETLGELKKKYKKVT